MINFHHAIIPSSRTTFTLMQLLISGRGDCYSTIDGVYGRKLHFMARPIWRSRNWPSFSSLAEFVLISPPAVIVVDPLRCTARCDRSIDPSEGGVADESGRTGADKRTRIGRVEHRVGAPLSRILIPHIRRGGFLVVDDREVVVCSWYLFNIVVAFRRDQRRPNLFRLRSCSSERCWSLAEGRLPSSVEYRFE